MNIHERHYSAKRHPGIHQLDILHARQTKGGLRKFCAHFHADRRLFRILLPQSVILCTVYSRWQHGKDFPAFSTSYCNFILLIFFIYRSIDHGSTHRNGGTCAPTVRPGGAWFGSEFSSDPIRRFEGSGMQGSQRCGHADARAVPWTRKKSTGSRTGFTSNMSLHHLALVSRRRLWRPFCRWRCCLLWINNDVFFFEFMHMPVAG